MADRVGQQLGNYRLTRFIDDGGFAEVYLGEHIYLGTEAAIKVMTTRFKADELEQFRAEARTIARLKHPHIIRILEFGIEDKTPFLVMDYAPAGTLRKRYTKGSRPAPKDILPYIMQAAAALQYAHDQRLIHRDIKPDNILLEDDKNVLLSDFGIAVAAHSSRSMNTQNSAGTIYYMAPEQIQGKPRPASDQYSLAITIYELLCGVRPFTGTSWEVVAQHLTATPTAMKDNGANIKPEIESVLMKALAKDPHQRYDSIIEFAKAFESASSQLPSLSNAPTLVDIGEFMNDKASKVPQAPPSYRGQRLGFFAGTRTDPGIKRKYKPNEDNLFAAQGVRSSQNTMQPFGVFIVADGMGVRADGQDASRLAVQTMIDFLLPNLVRTIATSRDELQRLLVEGVQRANQAVHKHKMEQHTDIGTTMTAVLIVDRTAFIVNVGDSRTYHYHPGSGLAKVTQDHSLAAALVDAGVIKPDDTYTHPQRNQMYRSLGKRPTIEVDSFIAELLPADKLLLCSDGLWSMVRDPQIETILGRNEPDPNLISTELITAALNGGGEDNVSVIVVQITEPANKQALSLDVQLIYKPDAVTLPQL